MGTFKTKDGKFVQAGLPPGSADLVGIASVRSIGVFVAIEVKLKGQKPRPDQVNFLEHVKNMGGIAGVATSVEDALNLLRQDPE